VSAPANATTLLPVYFFIQGGGLNTLSNPNPPPQHLIEAADFGIVVVSFNYRVGPWGFLASKEVQENGDLNVGLLDQRKALEWVQKYIHYVRYPICTSRCELTGPVWRGPSARHHRWGFRWCRGR
jgi:carboxylesterase type B